MRVRQYAYFELRSRHVSAAEMTARLGVEPDEFAVRASRRSAPPRPVFHSWRIVCREPGRTVDEQLTTIAKRLRPYLDRLVPLIGELAAGGAEHDGAVLNAVRFFGDEWGAEEELSPPDASLQKLPGQHQLLGWSLGRELLEFLLVTNAGLDVDEYG